ncbi:MAG: hypothetical protein O2894_10410 [Planctomycetota bacterium]|nr:hypothetical protein [Planctomycetota bacterium]
MRQAKSRWVGAMALALALVCAGCGSSEEQGAVLTVTSVPQAEVFVDGVGQGDGVAGIRLAPGEHALEFRREHFVTHAETVRVAAGEALQREVTLAAEDPSNPEVIAALAAAEGVDMAPFVAPEVHRGSRGARDPAILLWPAKEVRKEGLVNFAIEADETYEGDATIEFRQGRTILWRAAFRPESVTTIRPLPAEVLEHAQVSRSITWGLYFEDSRRPITTTFKIVQRPNADRQLARIAESRHMQRQPEITREIMAATVLENNRLYTEALVSNLTIAANHPNSTQPYRGILTTLRRLDAENSELYAFVVPHVGGKGGRAGIDRPSTGARAGGMDLGIAAWSPIQQGGVPSVVADAGSQGAKPIGPGGAGVTPTGGATGETPATPSTEPTSENGGVSAGSADESAAREMRAAIAALDAERAVADAEYEQAQADSMTAARAADKADADAKAAEVEAAEARAAVENAASPSREQQERMYRAGMAAEEAREAANTARQAAEGAEQKARAVEGRADALRQESETLGKALAAASGQGEAVPGTEAPSVPTEGELRGAQAAAETSAADARTSWQFASKQFEDAQQAYAADPSETNRNHLENAQASLDAAVAHVKQTQAAVDAAKRAVEQIGNQVQEAGRK